MPNGYTTADSALVQDSSVSLSWWEAIRGPNIRRPRSSCSGIEPRHPRSRFSNRGSPRPVYRISRSSLLPSLQQERTRLVSASLRMRASSVRFLVTRARGQATRISLSDLIVSTFSTFGVSVAAPHTSWTLGGHWAVAAVQLTRTISRSEPTLRQSRSRSQPRRFQDISSSET